MQKQPVPLFNNINDIIEMTSDFEPGDEIILPDILNKKIKKATIIQVEKQHITVRYPNGIVESFQRTDLLAAAIVRKGS